MVRHLRKVNIFIFLIICTFFIYTLFYLSSRDITHKFDSRELDKRLAALRKVVVFMFRRPDQMNVDAAFALMLAQAHIIGTSFHPNFRFLTLDQQNTLTTMLKMCEQTRQILRKRLEKELDIRTAEYQVNIYMNDLGPWVRPILWKRGLLKQTVPRKLNYNFKTMSYLIKNGTPSWTESNNCIRNTLIGIPKGNCKISDECKLMLLKDDNSQGYQITHRFLLVWIAKIFFCEESDTIFYNKLIPHYCSLTLQNLVDIKDFEYDLPIKDLIMEEVLLCGTQGYLEFTDDYLMNLILKWQHPEGCYASRFRTNKNKIRRKRNSNTIEFACDNHATGLGAASIALLTRRYIENAIFV